MSEPTARRLIAGIVLGFAGTVILAVVGLSLEAGERRSRVRTALDREVDHLSRSVGDRFELIAGDLGAIAPAAPSSQEDHAARTEHLLAANPFVLAVNYVDDTRRIRYTSPYAENEAVVGLKIAIPAPKEAMDEALARGRPTLSEPFELIQGGLGYSLMVPIGGRELIEVVVRVDGLFGRSSHLRQDDRLALFVRDGTVEARLEAGTSPLAYTVRTEVFGRELRIRTAPIDPRSQPERFWGQLATASIIGGGGLALCALVLLTRLVQDLTVAASAGRLASAALEQKLQASVDRLESAKRASAVREQLLSTTLDGLGDAVVFVDADGRVANMNSSAERLTGWRRGAARGCPFEEVVQLSYSREGLASSSVARALRGEPPVRHNEIARLRTRDGSLRHVTELASAVATPEGERTGAVLIVQDVSVQQEMRRELRQASKLESLGKICGGVAHDVNNQLMVIAGNAEQALLGLGRANRGEARRRLAKIVDAVERARAITSKLLTISRKDDPATETVDLTDLVDDIIDLVRRTVDRRIVVSSTYEARPCLVSGDGALLHTAVLNLALNACDSMPDGGSLSFEIRTSELDDEAPEDTGCHLPPGPYHELSVEDTGTGIRAEALQCIFDPFYTTKSQGRGTGLGLSTALKTAQSHKGWLYASSDPGKGSRFRLVLPRLPARPALPGPDDAPDEQDAGRGHLLVVDDEPEIRDVLSDGLRSLGYEVSIAVDGAEAVERFRRDWREIDLVLLDVVMPRMNGPDALRRMKAVHPEARVLFLTGYPSEGLTDVDSGDIVGVLGKPFSMRTLARTIAEAMARERTASRRTRPGRKRPSASTPT